MYVIWSAKSKLEMVGETVEVFTIIEINYFSVGLKPHDMRLFRDYIRLSLVPAQGNVFP